MDPSSSISPHSETITHMEPKWHKAALDGNAEALDDFHGSLECLLTPNQNIVLHLHLAIEYIPWLFCCYYVIYKRGRPRSTEFVRQILVKCPSLLWKRNAKGEIPLHIAARFGHPTMVQLLIKTANAEERNLEDGIDPAKKMWRMMDDEGDTALHKAVQYGFSDIVMLQALLQADPGFPYSVNHSGETPLYIAARRGHQRHVSLILDTLDSADYRGPCGRTALHAAVLSINKYALRVMLSKRRDLVKAGDENGQTALHYAAHFGDIDSVRLLLECDESAAYVTDKDQMTALHMAARQGHLRTMWEMIKHCPDCCEMVNKRGWNFYHFAMVSLPKKDLTKLIKDSSKRRFTREKDLHGNTPLQVLIASRDLHLTFSILFFDDIVTAMRENLDSKKKEKILELLKEVGDGEVGGVSVKPLHCYKKGYQNIDKMRQSRTLVAAVIATAAFAAGITLPGGYKSDESDGDQRGSAILSHDSAFRAFVIADSIAFISALLAIKFPNESASAIVLSFYFASFWLFEKSIYLQLR